MSFWKNTVCLVLLLCMLWPLSNCHSFARRLNATEIDERYKSNESRATSPSLIVTNTTAKSINKEVLMSVFMGPSICSEGFRLDANGECEEILEL